MNVRSSWQCAALLAAALSGCAGSDPIAAGLARGSLPEALAAYDGLPEADPERLVPIAERLLRDAALGDDAALADRAFAEMAIAGTHARALLEELASAPDPLRAARVWQRLAALGDGTAQKRLDALLQSDTPELRALALDAQSAPDAGYVLAALEAPQASLRHAAAQAVRRLSMSPALAAVLVELVRLDPEPGVRAAAAYALTAGPPTAESALTGALVDPDSSVHAAALDALWSVAPARAELHVTKLWGTDPTTESLEAARRVLGDRSRTPALAAKAREHLLAGLSRHDNALRAQAAVALASEVEQVADALSARLAVEGVPSVRLALALALGPARAADALHKLAAGDDVIAVEAAAALAANGDLPGLERLRALRASRLPAVRRVAYVALGRELGRVSEVRAGLSDTDAGVRLACAGAVLTGLAS